MKFWISILSLLNKFIKLMFKKAKQLFTLRSPKNSKPPQNPLYNQRKNQSSNSTTYQRKVNINLVFNQAQYKSNKDSQAQLQKRSSDMKELLSQSPLSISKITDLAWKGIQYRRQHAWKLLLGILSENPQNHVNQRAELEKKYRELLSHNDIQTAKRNHLINIDLKRTFTEIPLFSDPKVVQMLTRALCLWDMTGVGGYLQGMSDLSAIIFMILVKYDEDQTLKWFGTVNETELGLLESDLYWLCVKIFTKFFGYYTIGQHGSLQSILNQIENIIKASDPCLYKHLKENGIELVQFAFRWIYVMLSRQIPLRLVFRLWDSYFSSSDDFQKLHSFVVAELILRFSFSILKLNSFSEIIKTLQSLPTQQWSKKDIELLVQEAIVMMNIFTE